MGRVPFPGGGTHHLKEDLAVPPISGTWVEVRAAVIGAGEL